MSIFPYYVVLVGLLLMMLCSTKPLMWHVARACQSWCPILRATMIGHVWAGRHVWNRTNYSPPLQFSGMMVRLFCNQNISSIRENEDTTQKEAELRDLIISFEFLDLGMRTPAPHSPFSHVFFSLVILSCVLVTSTEKWVLADMEIGFWSFALLLPIFVAFLVPDNQQSHLRRGPLACDVSLRLARKVSL